MPTRIEARKPLAEQTETQGRASGFLSNFRWQTKSVGSARTLHTPLLQPRAISTFACIPIPSIPFCFIPTTKHHKNQIQEPPSVASNPIVPGLSSEPARKIGRSIYQSKERSLVAFMERMSSSVQSWVEDHKLATIGGVWAAAVGASVAYSRRAPQRATSLRLIHARIHAQALTLAVLGGAALMHYYSKSSASKRRDDLDYDFYSQLPAATDADGKENERWSW